MSKTIDASLTVEEAKRIADTCMESTLRRAREGRLRASEATKCAALLKSVELWSGLQQRCVLVEQSREIIRLAKRLEARKAELPDELLAKIKAATRTAFVEAAAEAARVAKAARRRKARPRK